MSAKESEAAVGAREARLKMSHARDEAQPSSIEEGFSYAGQDDADTTPTTVIIFHTDAYLGIFPYCKAILERDKIQV
ncbi:hypothetical protein BIW11_01122, partial [Tropilaelaps mercedesae]